MNERESRKALSNRLKEAREYAGFSQEEVAKYLKVPRSAISLMESGSRKIDTFELTKLSKLYQRSIAELTGSQESSSAQDESIKMVARATSELSEKDREEVLRFALFLQSKSKDSK